MGMSASQARLIALTARMNDIEYQGQQINQQRTTLSNQVNALYNTLLDMTVPTPPSTKDFTKVVYSGKQGASSFTLGNITPGKTENTYNVDMKYTKTGHSWESNSDVNIKQGKTYYQEVDLSSITSEKVKVNKYSLDNNDKINNINQGYENLTEEEGNEDVILKIKASVLKDLTDLLGANSELYISGDDSVLSRMDETSSNAQSDKTALEELKDEFVYIKLNKSDFLSVKEDETETNSLLNVLADDDSVEAYSNITQQEEYQISDSMLTTLGYTVITSTGKPEPATADMFDVDQTSGTVTLKQGYAHVGIPANSSVATDEHGNTINGFIATGSDTDDQIFVNNQYKSLQEAKELLDGIKDDSKRKAYIQGLENKFPELYKESTGESDFLAMFKGYTYQTDSGSIVYCMVLKSDINNNNGNSVPTYEYIANGTYVETQNKEGSKLEFDTEGRITKLGIPNDRGGWDYIDLTASEETDDKAYKDAFNQYEYAKYKYDLQQKEINAKTSIIQQEDKNLELKLTRLDNERNAVNTELEAVKKVVNDNIEKSFKTFNG